MTLTQSQQLKVDQITAAFDHEYGIEHRELEEGKFSPNESITLSLASENHRYSSYAIIGKKGAIRSLSFGDYKDNDLALYHLGWVLNEMRSEGIEVPEKEIKVKAPKKSGISFYKTDQGPGGYFDIGIENNPTTRKYFDTYFEGSGGIMVRMAWIPTGGDGVLFIPVSDYDKDDARVEFGYEPGDYLKIYNTDYEEEISGKLNVRQVISRLFQAWLKNENLL